MITPRLIGPQVQIVTGKTCKARQGVQRDHLGGVLCVYPAPVVLLTKRLYDPAGQSGYRGSGRGVHVPPPNTQQEVSAQTPTLKSPPNHSACYTARPPTATMLGQVCPNELIHSVSLHASFSLGQMVGGGFGGSGGGGGGGGGGVGGVGGEV